MVRKYLYLRKLRKQQDNVFNSLNFSKVEPSKLVGVFLANFRLINNSNTDTVLNKLLTNYVDNTESMVKALQGSLSEGVSEKHIVAKTKDLRILLELDYIDDKLANCRINLVCSTPAAIMNTITKYYDDYGSEFSDQRVSHYSFARYNQDDDLLLALYMNSSYKDMLYIHITDMQFSGL